MYYYKFARWDAIPIEQAKNHVTIKAIEEYENGNKKPLRDRHLVLDTPSICVGGWRFDLRPYLKRFWVKLRGYGINEYYAMNKTDIRHKFDGYVIEIVEIKNKEDP